MGAQDNARAQARAALSCFLRSSTDSEAILDARGLKCPLPVIMTEKRLATLKAGTALVVFATDPVAKVDIPLYCRQNGFACAVSEADGVLRFSIDRPA